MEPLKTALNWFEIPATDFDRAVNFYSAIYAFDMPIRDMGHIRMGFFQHEPGSGVGGSIVHGDGYIPARDGPKLYLNGGLDLRAMLDWVESAGGKVVLGKTQIPAEIGYFAIIDDTEGNWIHLHSTN